jgi:accessory gene regulator protein AgrB
MASEQKKRREEGINPMGGVRPTPLSICKTEYVGFVLASGRSGLLAAEATVLLILIPSLLPSAPWKEKEEKKKKKKKKKMMMMMMMVVSAAIADKQRAQERELGDLG